ncbi:MAG: RNA pyrophosphohydrolase [Succinivibrio sp.]|nr:RNA pyrophosphohydrolase [Succinivibrio sp.]
MIDGDGFRPNVGIVICNRASQVLWARRIRQNSWQFPQGGVDEGESAETAMYRELYEELGLKSDDVELLACSKSWLKYRLPKRLVRWEEKPVCLGQKQKWFLLRLTADKQGHIEFNVQGHPEFDDWRWVSYWYPVRQVVAFKRDVYRHVLTEFAGPALFGPQLDRKGGAGHRSDLYRKKS